MDRVRKALHGVRAGLRKVIGEVGNLPRWALVAVGITAIAIVGEVAFLVVQSSGEGGSPTAEQQQQLPCNKRQAQRAITRDRFAQQVRELGTVPPLAEVLEIYEPKLVGCADLTEDGIDEMVLQLTEINAPPAPTVEPTPEATETTPEATETTPEATETTPEEPETIPDATETIPEVTTVPATSVPQPWAIYRVEDGSWAPALVRTRVPAPRLAIVGHRVRETSAALTEGDALCCPTGEREGVVRWKGDAFAYKALAGSHGRTIALADGEAATLGGFDLQEGSLTAAIEFFGPPSTYAPEGDELCPAKWEDLGLRIEFANLGGFDPCGPEGRVARAAVYGVEAATVGWKTQEGATIDISEEELRELYPEMEPREDEEASFDSDQPQGTPFTLVDRPTEVAIEGLEPPLSARMGEDGAVVGFELGVGAAAE